MKKYIVIIFIIILIGLFLTFIIPRTKITLDKDIKPLSESNFYKDYYNTNNLILIDVWATWCQPCIMEFPVVNYISDQYDNKDLKFITVSIDTDTQRLKKFLDKNPDYKVRDITFDNAEFIDSISRKIKLVDSYFDNSIIKVSSKEIPYLVLIKNKKILYQSRGETDTILLKSIIDKNLNH